MSETHEYKIKRGTWSKPSNLSSSQSNPCTLQMDGHTCCLTHYIMGG